MVLHAAGRWAESRDVLAKADELAQKLDFTSVTEETGALLGNETVRVYRGEDFEKLMISVLQALNYAAMGDDEGALVEIRRCNERLEKMKAQNKPYEQLAIARYLSGMLYEDQREWDSAAIDYVAAAELQPNLGVLNEATLRLTKKTERVDLYERMAKKFPGVEVAAPAAADGQVAVVIEAGEAPRKEQGKAKGGPATFVAVPVYNGRQAPVPAAVVTFGSGEVRAVPVTSIDRVAKLHLDDRIGKLVAKSLASAGLKAGVAAGVGALTKSPELGVLAFAALSLTQEADTRSWLSLPAEFQVARARLPAGKQKVVVRFRGKTTEHEVEVVPGRLKVLVLRRY